MFGLGLSEILLILGLALIFIGPERLPDLARSLAKGYHEFRRSFEEVRTTIHKDLRAVDTENLLRQGKEFPLNELKQTLLASGDDKLVPPQALSPYPEDVEDAAPAGPTPPAPAPSTELSANLRAELKAELKAELLAELRAELAKGRQQEVTDER